MKNQNAKLKIPKERYISPEKRQQIIDELKLKLTWNTQKYHLTIMNW